MNIWHFYGMHAMIQQYAHRKISAKLAHTCGPPKLLCQNISAQPEAWFLESGSLCHETEPWAGRPGQPVLFWKCAAHLLWRTWAGGRGLADVGSDFKHAALPGVLLFSTDQLPNHGGKTANNGSYKY